MNNRNFRRWISKTKKERGSSIILALDYTIANPHELLLRSKKTIENLSPYICGVKFNRHLVLPLGLYSGVKELLGLTRKLGLPSIMDCKINDIGATNRTIAHHYYSAGFDSVTANPFIGWEDGLNQVFKISNDLNKGVILLVYMSHKGALEGYAQRVKHPNTNKEYFQYQIFAEKALKWNADGVIVGATYPQKIFEINKILNGKIPIYSPGIGVQGGNIDLVAKGMSDYFIIGRSILNAKDPIQYVQNLNEIINRSSKD
jgi:orotidine-5'-phosphate decarboxylase